MCLWLFCNAVSNLLVVLSALNIRILMPNVNNASVIINLMVTFVEN